ncbi:uncharacterized protein J7T54_000540 [Emericellopsis cladophorae]|uniref:Uncharacterized protein n=1 Tax=Emericellopsis cladophorae TaxID=2686198 RepID=A0A9P9XW20_9HYPO|nr:uncharacterized protein J7T54_000540 [Emericellopsis cladophorae]KAI6778884.1 hypothetical protein J7T54_000540 [Emericellopsis cladophorae]
MHRQGAFAAGTKSRNCVECPTNTMKRPFSWPAIEAPSTYPGLECPEHAGIFRLSSVVAAALAFTGAVSAAFGDGNAQGIVYRGTGYAALRFAHENGRLDNSEYTTTNVRVTRLISRGGGIFCVSISGAAEIGYIDLANSDNNAVHDALAFSFV